MKHVHTLIISDIHLGSKVSRSDALLNTLKQHTFERLILLGDIFEDLNFKRLQSTHWELLSHIRRLSDEKTGAEIIWIAGNHDALLVDVMSHLLGVQVLMDYKWEYNGKKYLAIHGHQFDSFMTKNKRLSRIAAIFYRLFQKVDGKKHVISRQIKRTSKTWLKVSEEIAAKAIAFGKENKVDHVFCGHTHQSISREANGVKYSNTGCWTDIPSTYVTIDLESGVSIREVR